MNLDDFTPINIELDKIIKLSKLDINNFKNGLVIIELLNTEVFPIVFRHKILTHEDLINNVQQVIENIKSHVDIYVNNYTTIVSWKYINNNLIILRIK
jgi:hypothetical protein